MQLPFEIDCRPPFLIATFPEPQRVLSWAVTHPGLNLAARVAWLEVRNKDLPEDVDALQYIRAALEREDLGDAVTLITSRDIRRYHLSQACVEGLVATCLTTVGLSNAERVGVRSTEPVPQPGTINTLVHVAAPLSKAALLETLSVVTQARTAAVLESGVRRDGVAITGTGTDCIAVAAPPGTPEVIYAGLHTAIGEAVGKCTYAATSAGIATWRVDFDRFATADATL